MNKIKEITQKNARDMAHYRLYRTFWNDYGSDRKL